MPGNDAMFSFVGRYYTANPILVSSITLTVARSIAVTPISCSWPNMAW